MTPVWHGVRLLLAVLAGAICVVYGGEVARDVRLAAPAPTPIVLDRDGAFVTQAGHWDRDRVEYGYWVTAPPDRVVRATLALEDRRFWWHPGVDPLAVLRAVWRGGSGASTIAMQVARMQHPRARTLWAKAVEAGTAVALTARYGRQAVLAQYLRLAPYGEGSHGIGHAARWFFDRPAADLDWAQAALLAAVPQAPARLALRHAGSQASARAQRALDAMVAQGAMGAAEHDAALAALAAPEVMAAPRRPAALHAALRLERAAAALPWQAEPLVRAALDLRLQAGVTAMAAAQVRRWGAEGAQQAAVMVVRRGTRDVLATVGGVAGPGQGIDFTAVSRSPGSTLKPFLYAEALQAGVIAPQDVLADAPEGSAGIHNADHAYLGPLLPRQALANSRNVPAAVLLRRIGLQPAFSMLRRLGVHALAGSAERFGLAMAIGALPSSLERLMGAYATLAEDGRAGDLVYVRGQGAEAGQVIAPEAARLVTRFLSDPMARLPSFPRYGASEFPFAVALKTGTSQGFRDAWTFAWSESYLVGVWVGRPDSGPMSQVSGARAAGQLAQAVLLRLHGRGRADLLAGAFAAPRGLQEAELCTGTGRPGACAERLTEWVRPGPERATAPPRLDIVQPEPDTHVWRNPEAPAALDRLVLRAAAGPGVAQIVWLVDGRPLATVAPDQPVYWPLQPGRHRFQVRLPLQDEASRPLTVVVD